MYKSIKSILYTSIQFICITGLQKDTKKTIVGHTFDGNAPLFLAAQQGQVHFVNYLLEECYANIEQKGVYEVAEDRSKHQVGETLILLLSSHLFTNIILPVLLYP